MNADKILQGCGRIIEPIDGAYLYPQVKCGGLYHKKIIACIECMARASQRLEDLKEFLQTLEGMMWLDSRSNPNSYNEVMEIEEKIKDEISKLEGAGVK